jgi:hypothetical protein
VRKPTWRRSQSGQDEATFYRFRLLTRVKFIFSLATILEKRSLAPSKLDEIKVKANIIKAFFEGKKDGEKEGNIAQKATAEL